MSDLVWDSLSNGWQTCLENAWEALLRGTIPIGAAVTDAAGTVLAVGRNRIYDGNPDLEDSRRDILAHAELNALKQLRASQEERHTYILYTSLEPCPLCMGAFYMSGLRELHFAARDAYAGSSNLIGKTPYLRRKPVRVHPPPDPTLEIVLIGIHTAFSLRRGDSFEQVLAEWMKVTPEGVRFGRYLRESDTLNALVEQNIGAREAFTGLCRLVEAPG